MEAEAAQAAIEMTRAEPCGVVRLTCPVGLLDSTVSSMLARFMMQCPRVDIHLEATNRRVDLVEEAVDLAIQARRFPLDDSDWVMRHLGDRQQCLVASPALLDDVGELQLPEELLCDGPLGQLPSLWLGQPHQDFEWVLENSDGTRATIKHEPRFITLDMVALRCAAVAGVGVVQLPHMMVRDELQRELLVEVFPDWTLQPEAIHIVFLSQRGLLPSVRALIDFLVDEFKAISDE